ncbi:hypothetical protein C7B62_23005 [Pleurocapsa sp. CCALA 161]|uniref:hypothetical protein n=1 Tax=Pleurocapsa sp. CCALA 161 TaxID=2107688 RepID=UPI000D056390|nr:hypothetical protein [Pleurocapsa sp. CCALA 161]PSB06375.1 hypothetical protein C7B62_23005 [Pleurocapsa sp. CCALA 161]
MVKFVSELYNKYPGSDIYVVGTGASLRVFPLSFLEGKIVIGLNMAWKVAPVQYAITNHPDLNIPEFMPDEQPHPEITWISGYQKKEAGIALKGVESAEMIEYAKNNFYFFDHLHPDRLNTQAPNLPCDRGRVLEWVRKPTENYLYFWGSISNAGVCLAANMGAKNVILIGCDNCSLLANHHAHNQHVRWKGVNPNQRYRQYYEALAEVRTELRTRGVNILSLTPFVNLAKPEEDFVRLCQELDQPKLIENNVDISPRIRQKIYYDYYIGKFKKILIKG